MHLAGKALSASPSTRRASCTSRRWRASCRRRPSNSSADWHVCEETLAKAQATLDNFVLHHPLSRFWGDGTRSSSDGMRVKVAVRAANAERNAEYFHYDRGVTIYTHTADIRLPFA